MAPGDQPLLVLGTHNFAPELLDLISETPGFRVDGFVENVDRARTELEIEGLPVYWIDDADRFAATHLAVCALGTTTRSRLIEEAAGRGWGFVAIVHPRARVSARSEFGEGSVASVNVVVAVNARIGRHVILNRGASIGHDTVVGDYVTVGPGVNVAGLCSIGDGCYLRDRRHGCRSDHDRRGLGRRRGSRRDQGRAAQRRGAGIPSTRLQGGRRGPLKRQYCP